MREWVIYVGIMAIVLFFVFRDQGLAGALAGLLVSGPLYLVFGFVLAKFGYQRKSLKELRTARAEPRKPKADAESASSARTRPPPTSRTSTGINRPNAKKKRR